MSDSVDKLVASLPDGETQEYVLQKGKVTLGRSALSDIVLPDQMTSRNHAEIEYTIDGPILRDLGSRNGTRVNGSPVQQIALTSGDVIVVGSTTLRFQSAPEAIAGDATTLLSDLDMDMAASDEATALGVDPLATALNNTSETRLTVHTATKTWEVSLEDVDSLSLGRGGGNDVVIGDPAASRSHARIEHRSDSYVLIDQQSSNGTWIGDQRVDEQVLKDGDTIRIGRARLVFKAGFGIDDLNFDLTPAERRPVVFVPGAMGTELWRGEDRIWPNVRQLLQDPGAFHIENPLEPRGLVGQVVVIPNVFKMERYNRFSEFLEETLGYERGRDLLEVGYDWRNDLRQAARLLHERIEDWGVDRPITLVAHSMGCLVARYYVERLGGKNKVERLILLGGPHNGFPKSILFLATGRDMLPFGMLRDRIREGLANFPAFYQLLPPYACIEDETGRKLSALRDESWVAEPQRHLLRDALKFRRELGASVSVPVVSVFGYGLKTVTGLRVSHGSDGMWRKLELVIEEGGDATVPDSSAIVKNSEIHPVQQHHGSLYVDNDVRKRLRLELTRSAAR